MRTLLAPKFPQFTCPLPYHSEFFFGKVDYFCVLKEADTGSVKNAPAESSVHVVKEDDRQLRLFYSVEEMGIFREMLGWLSSHFPPNSTCRTPSKRTGHNQLSF